MSKTKIVVLAAVVLLAAFAVWKWAGRSPFRYAGTVEATEIDLSARVASVIGSYAVKEGDPVGKDQVLVTLSCEDLKLAADSAQADCARAKKLFQSGAMPFEAYDHLRVKRDDLALRTGWCTVRSPVKGTVLDVYHEAAEWVTPGVKLLTVGDLSEVWAVFYVPQTSLAGISAGMAVTGVLPEMPGRSFEGRVAHIASEAEFTPKNVQTRKERTRLVYGIKAFFPNPDGILKPGMTLEAVLPD